MNPIAGTPGSIESFLAKYGIKVKGWRSSSENVVQRVLNQTRAGKLEVDLIENNSPEMEALRAELPFRKDGAV